LACALEKRLFLTSTSLNAYSDLSTLDLRLQLIFVAAWRRRQQKNRGTERSDALQAHLGAGKYMKVLELVNKIKMLQFNEIMQYWESCAHSGYCESKASSLFAQKAMPEAIRKLYFDMCLLKAVETTPIEHFPYLSWDTLIEEARSNMRSYEEWNGNS
jgi:hypothetical protein